VVVFLLSGELLAQSVIRQGGEFQINRYTFNHQADPAIAVDPDGDFVVSWTDSAQDSTTGIFAARFNSSGTVLAGEFHVNTYTPAFQTTSSIAMESNGDFVIVWQSYRQVGYANSYSVFGQRFNSSGTRLGVEFQINTYTLGYAFRARIASDSDGDFVVVWQEKSELDGDSHGVFGRRFNSSGAALAVEFQVNSYTNTGQYSPSVALDADGDFVVAWDSGGSHDGDSYGVFGQRFNSAGTRLGGEFRVNSYTFGAQGTATVAAEADGDFVVAFQSNQDADNAGVFAQRFTSAGVALASEFQVNVYTIGYQRSAEVAADDNGDFVVTWESQHQDGSYQGVFARRYSASGTAVGSEFRVNTYTFETQYSATVDWDSDGDFVVAWESQPHQDGDGYGVFAQRFKLPQLATLDIDGNGLVEPLTDGLLHLRHRFGFSGSTLTGGAVSPNCTRCAAADITAYLNGLGLVMDIDNNGALDPLTDGLLVLRFTFGFTGTTLTNGAVAGNCVTRCDASTILPYLQMLATPGG
jgi:hypothetical protein